MRSGQRDGESPERQRSVSSVPVSSGRREERGGRTFHVERDTLMCHNRNVRCGPTILMRRAGGVLQCRGVGKIRGVRYLEDAHAVIRPRPGCPLCTDDSYASGREGFTTLGPGFAVKCGNCLDQCCQAEGLSVSLHM